MVDFKKYYDRIEKRIGDAAADKILEGPWWDIVIKDLNLMSYYFAHDMGIETAHRLEVDPKNLVNKGTYKLPFEEWSHGRMTALNLILSYWLGFQSPTHGPRNGLDAINQAYSEGLNGYLQSDGGKKWLENDEGKEWLESPEGKRWLETPNGKEWLKQQQQKESALKPTKTAAEVTQQPQPNAKTDKSDQN